MILVGNELMPMKNAIFKEMLKIEINFREAAKATKVHEIVNAHAFTGV